MESRRITLKVVTPVHIGDAYGLYPGGTWRAKNGYVAVLDEDKYAELVLQRGGVVPLDELDDQYFVVKEPKLPVRSAGREHRTDLRLFIRDGNGERYVPGSSIKGAIFTALLMELCKANKALLDDMIRAFSQRWWNPNKPQKGFQNWYRKNIAKPHHDPMRAISVSDGKINGEFEAVLTMRVGARGGKIPQFFEYLVSGTVEFVLSFDKDLWDYLAGTCPWKNLTIKGIEDIVDIWTRNTREVLRWVSTRHPPHVSIEVPVPDRPVVLGRNSGWPTKTIGYLLAQRLDFYRDRKIIDKICNRYGRNRQGWPLPRTFWSANGRLPGILEINTLS